MRITTVIKVGGCTFESTRVIKSSKIDKLKQASYKKNDAYNKKHNVINILNKQVDKSIDKENVQKLREYKKATIQGQIKQAKNDLAKFKKRPTHERYIKAKQFLLKLEIENNK